MYLSLNVLKPIPRALIKNVRHISTTPSIQLIQKWRQDRGLPLNPNACGVLTDGADYSYVDGRPTPYGVRQANRLEQQQKLAESILQYTQEIDFAKQRHENLQTQKEEVRKQILTSKLKAKGELLLRDK